MLSEPIDYYEIKRILFALTIAVIVCGFSWFRSINIEYAKTSSKHHFIYTHIDLNQADLPTLTLVPGIGPSLARSIVLFREKNGPFFTLKDLERVSGMGPSKVRECEKWFRIEETIGFTLSSECK